MRCHFCDIELPVIRGRAPDLPTCADCMCGVYALVDPGTSLIEYVGASSNIKRRYKEHRKYRSDRDGFKYREKADFVRKHGPACMVLLERCAESELGRREFEQLDMMRMLGHPLRFSEYPKHEQIERTDLSGRQFGSWLVLRLHTDYPQSSKRRWLCECSCGTVRDVVEQNLIAGLSKKCKPGPIGSCPSRRRMR